MILLATLCINEMEWLPRLVQQHRFWPDVVSWVFVEGSDIAYADASPSMVDMRGLSVDGTTGFLSALQDELNGVEHVKHGLFGDGGPQGKCAPRNEYMKVAEELGVSWVIVIDADEFYTHEDQQAITELLQTLPRRPIQLKQRHLWRPESIATRNLLDLEVVGGYWRIGHTRIWPMEPGLRYTVNHNTPADTDGRLLSEQITISGPQCVHAGFASTRTARKAKHAYYVKRGEGMTDGRQMYVDCRQAFEWWKPGEKLPHGARVIDYDGPKPEALL